MGSQVGAVHYLGNLDSRKGLRGQEQTGKDPSGVGAGVEESVMEERERRELLPETSVTHFPFVP